jgi:hypothetical protein
MVFSNCKFLFCFVGEHRIITWACVQKPETANRADESPFLLAFIPLMPVLAPTKQNDFHS